AAVVAAARTAKQFLTYVNGGPFQPAIAVGLALPDHFFTDLATNMQQRRDQLVPALHAAGFTVFSTSSTYFVTVDVSPLRADGDGIAFCHQLARERGVVAIPNEVFYLNKHIGRPLVRFAFCKRAEVIAEAARRLTN
ncbi:MAG TPA: aminotransferase class I/II-fold pyridoxal phosphate-dependent enzyme, partial [Ilumatobacteraceae bacterium]|nr:aminotransferase class I/II-fold pyridoxal phosphate-dependent enzyme [Ilumatobacteraceae bacterium]